MNKKILVLRITFATLLICTFVIIFQFSSQNGEVSSGTSTRMMYKIIDVLNGKNEVTLAEVEKYEPLLRKLAHFGIYTFVGIWAMCLMSTYFVEADERKREKLQIAIAVLIGFLYACSDEVHQLFSMGRSGQVIDVVIDTIGVATGAICILLVIKVMKGRKIEKI